MTRSSARRTSAVQVEKSLPSVSSTTENASSPASLVPWNWRLALFLWTTSYACLFLYELLAGLIKAW